MTEIKEANRSVTEPVVGVDVLKMIHGWLLKVKDDLGFRKSLSAHPQKSGLSVLSRKRNKTHAKLNLLLNLMGPTRDSGVLKQIGGGGCTCSKLNRTAHGTMAQVPSSTPRCTRRATYAPQFSPTCHA